MTSKSMTAVEVMTERRDFLHFHVVPSIGGPGWDVVLRIDGTYSDRETAEAVAEMLRRECVLADVPMTGRRWWDGPPWKRNAP